MVIWEKTDSCFKHGFKLVLVACQNPIWVCPVCPGGRQLLDHYGRVPKESICETLGCGNSAWLESRCRECWGDPSFVQRLYIRGLVWYGKLFGTKR